MPRSFTEEERRARVRRLSQVWGNLKTRLALQLLPEEMFEGDEDWPDELVRVEVRIRRPRA